VRTEGIYTIMITLAIGVAFFYLAQQNYTVFNGFQGLSKIAAPELGGIDFREPVPFYFVALGCALAGYFLVKHLVRAPFGVACKASATTRAGWNRSATTSPRTASPRTPVAGLLAAVGGVLMVWYNGRISPGPSTSRR
jgi:branched-chain amino acid transport system permease protein